jgi:hypothetical protein
MRYVFGGLCRLFGSLKQEIEDCAVGHELKGHWSQKEREILWNGIYKQ